MNNHDQDYTYDPITLDKLELVVVGILIVILGILIWIGRVG